MKLDQSDQPISLVADGDFRRLSELAKGGGPERAEQLEQLLVEIHAKQEAARPYDGPGVYSRNVIALTGPEVTIQPLWRLVQVLQQADVTPDPIAEMAACLELMFRWEKRQERYGWDALGYAGDESDHPFTYAQLQAHLSRTLVQHPVLMDSRCLVTTWGHDNDEYATVAAAIANLTFAALPSAEHGLAQADLRAFANHPSVRRGVSDRTPERLRGDRSSALGDMTPLRISNTRPSRGTRGAFLASLLELNDLADIAEKSGPALIRTSDGSFEHYDIFRSLAAVFWEVVRTGGQRSNVSARQMAATLRLRAPFGMVAPDDTPADFDGLRLSTALARQTGVKRHPGFHELNGDFGMYLDLASHGWLLDAKQTTTLLSSTAAARTRAAIALLVDAGLASSPARAAEILSYAILGSGLNGAPMTATPEVSMNAALGFLVALQEHGIVPAAYSAERVAQIESEGRPAAAAARSTWSEALNLHRAESFMHGVIADGGASTDDLAAAAPTTKRSRLV